MSILNRDVFNEYNVDYNPVGLRNISLPNSFFTSLNAYEFNPTDIQSRIDAAKNREALNKQGLMALDDAGFVTEPYETFAEKAKPGLNIDFAKQIGSSALSLLTGNPFIGLLARGIGALGNRFSLPGVRGGADLRGDTGFDTFRRSTSLADFMQRRRDKKAREDAAARGAAKQKDKTRLDMFRALRDSSPSGGGGGGGFDGPSPGSQGPGGSDEMGSF
tara:strand:+ start:37 stop:690 length:654 start_codon:yes stop_codon:yes gene_type:complete